MTREEVKEMFNVIKAIYPAFQKDVPKQTISRAIDLWTALFADDTANVVLEALHAYISTDTKGFAPSPGQIKEKMYMIFSKEEMSEVEAWGYLKKAISKGGYHAEEEHKKLPNVIRKIVTPTQIRDWAMSDVGTEQVIASNFMRSYRAKKNMQTELNKLPQTAKMLREAILEKEQLKLQ